MNFPRQIALSQSLPSFRNWRAWRTLRDLALRDTNIVVASVVLTNLLRMASSIILTRLLMPEVFGVAGLIASVQFTVALATDLGFQAFVVRHEDGDKKRFLDTVWTVSLIRSSLLALVLIGLSGQLAELFGKPELAPMIAVSGLAFVIEGLASLTLLTALRNRKILQLSVLELVALVVQIAASAVLAYLWGDYWAILVGLMIGSAVKTVLSYAMFTDALRRFALDRRYLRDLWMFARYVTGSSIIFLLISQCDKLVLAKVMSLDMFGFYILAGNLASAPLGFATAYASRVLYPTYSQMFRENEGDLRARFYAKRRMVSLLYALATGGLIGSAPLIIGVLYDDRYASAALYLQILCIAALFALNSNAANETLTATGRVRATFEASCAKLVWLAAAGALAYFYAGAMGLIVAVGLMEIPAMLLKWARMQFAGLLDLRQELLFVGAGALGLAGGFGAHLALSPLLV